MRTDQSSPLRRSVEPPARNQGWFAVTIGLVIAAFAATGASLPVLLLMSAPILEVRHEHVPASDVIAPEPVIAVPAEPSAPSASGIHFVEVVDGTTYLMIAPLEDGTMPPGTGTPHLVGSVQEPLGATATIEPTAGAEFADWLGRGVVFDNGCRARVTGFAAVALMSGTIDYMGIGPDAAPAEVADLILGTGAQLAAVLDGCTGRYGYAADAGGPVLPEPVVDPDLLAAARARLLGSADARAADAAWREAGHEGTWHEAEWTELDTRAYRHPRTGVLTISVMANADVGCGGADIRLWSIYEVGADGVWTERVATTSGPLSAIETAIDVDGDGTLEWLGSEYLGDRLLIRIADRQLITAAELQVPFYGCPC
jgi:hypothetical protein